MELEREKQKQLEKERGETEDEKDPKVKQFIAVLSYVPRKDLEPFYEIAKRDVNEAVSAYYSRKVIP